ncbi:hypothetical protein L2E82_29698 [Cichorium intybus]|uniref:Uncharacterized protein n=1 Tax=Cichorium intybus TaxID=13427 RepID=A0ACB9CYP0_CICIN|nr:hypothetical protein L2E82_29698 [Cichorium intybus]
MQLHIPLIQSLHLKPSILPERSRNGLVSSQTPPKHTFVVTLSRQLFTDFRAGWSSRLTLFNWDDAAFRDWFMAVELDKSTHEFEKVYSFNGTVLEINGKNDQILMQGLPGLNYLVGEVDGANPEKPTGTWEPTSKASIADAFIILFR